MSHRKDYSCTRQAYQLTVACGMTMGSKMTCSFTVHDSSGGIPFDATQTYSDMCLRLTFVKCSFVPFTTLAEIYALSLFIVCYFLSLTSITCGTIESNDLSIGSSPHHRGWRIPICMAGQRHIVSLPHFHRRWRRTSRNCRGYCNHTKINDLFLLQFFSFMLLNNTAVFSIKSCILFLFPIYLSCLNVEKFRSQFCRHLVALATFIGAPLGRSRGFLREGNPC